MRIAIDDVGYHVRDSGGEGPAVLLVHGAPDEGSVWRAQQATLAEAGYRVICPDLIGYGQSERPAPIERYGFGSQQADLVRLLDQLGVDRFHLVAHDFGASIGWIWAATQPERLLSYTALSVGHPAAYRDLSLDQVRYAWNLFMNADPQAAELSRAGGGALVRRLVQGHPDADAVVERLLEPGALEVVLDWDRANAVPAFFVAAYTGQLPEGLLPPVKVRTLGIWSDRDHFVWEEQMTGSAPHVEGEWVYARLEDAGHWFMLERPEETNALLLDWLGAAA